MKSQHSAMGRQENQAFVALVALLILLNPWTLVTAVPETAAVDGGCCAPGAALAKDFSAFYTAAYRLYHDPSQIYYHGILNDGETMIPPEPEAYKYLPSFLLMVTPFLLLPYGQSLLAFDYFQFALLPIIAAMIYVLLRGRGLLATSAVAVAVLTLPLPLPTPQWVLSASYYWQWAEGQSKVLETFLLLGALVLAKSGRPRMAGVALGLAAFDPRFVLLGAPLVIAYSKDLKGCIACAAATFALTNFILFYPPTLLGFLTATLTSGLSTPLYYYSFIPISALASLFVLDRTDVILAIGRLTTRVRQHSA